MNPFKSKLDARIRAERMHVLVQNQPTSLISTLAVSLFLVYILAPVTSPMYGILWMGAMIALTSIRAVHLRKVKQLEASDYLAQEKWLLYGAFLSGSLFGSSVLVLFPYDNVGLQALLFFLMSSMIAGSVAVYSTHILAFLAYSLPIFLFFFYRAFTLTELFLFLAFIGIFYYVIMVTTMMRVNRSIIKTFNTQFLNHDLANNLSHAKENLEKFNHELFEENQAHLKTQKRLYHLANYDPLTGLANRNMFKESLKDSLKTAQQEHTTMAVLFLDLDNFKIINDTLGHAMGDKLLIGASSRLKSLINDKSFIARLGGDEFVIIVNEVQESEEISTLAQKIINLLEKPFTFDENEMYIGTSIGISLFPKDGQVAETLIAYADTAMYKAKEKGKNNYQFFNANMYDQMQFRHDIETKLHHAIAKNELRIDYQPKVDVQENRIVGAEALLRWEHTELGEVSPSVFIPIAEESSLINTIGKWVIQKVCEDLAFIREHFDASLSISVNISSSQILHQNLPELIGEHLQRHTLPPQSLELEFTENMLIKQSRKSIQVLHELDAMGIRLAIDDFGTGYSSLNYLKTLPIHTLKIDKSFITDTPLCQGDCAIVKTIITLAQNLNLSLVAEGIETTEQLTFLKNNGCHLIQGFFFSQPLDRNAFCTYLSEPGIENTLGYHLSSV